MFVLITILIVGGIVLFACSSGEITYGSLNGKVNINNSTKYAEPNYIAYALARPNDNEYGQQWGLKTANMEAAWDQQQGSIDISVAVLDSGIIPNHDDLDGNLANGANFVGGNTADSPYNFEETKDPTDMTPESKNGSHGTHVAGIIGALTNNSIGVAGMSWGINIIPIRVLDSNQEGTIYDITEGIYYAAGNNGDSSLLYPAAYPHIWMGLQWQQLM